MSASDMKSQLEESLSLNTQMQSKLLVMRERLEKLLSNVKDTYESNEDLIKEGNRKKIKGIGMKGAYLKGGTFYFRGNMFFKDIKCRSCPNNKDYENRKKEKEIFPMDFNLKARHMWSTSDKQGIILGIKEQIIDYLTQQSVKPIKRSKEINSEKLAKLLKMVPEDFQIDWDYISACNLIHRHSAKNCEAIWTMFLHPSLNRSVWSEKENHKLLEMSRKFNFQNWQEIAKEFGQRSDFQCFVQYKNHVCHMLPESYTKWSKEDDKRLVEAVAKNTVNGNINWSNVQAYFPNKAKTTIHSRYNNTMNPNISRGAFTPEEDVLLIAALKEYGKFNCIPRSLFPNRSLIQLRSHYKNTLCKRHTHQPWILEDDIKLMEFVNENGAKSWVECEKMFESRHTRAGCRTRYLTIKRHLSKNPDCSIENLPRKRQRNNESAPSKLVNIQNWKQKVDELSSNNKIEQQNQEEALNTEEQKLEKRKRKRKIPKNVEKANAHSNLVNIQNCKQNVDELCSNNKIEQQNQEEAPNTEEQKLEKRNRKRKISRNIEKANEAVREKSIVKEKLTKRKERKPVKQTKLTNYKTYFVRLKGIEKQCYNFFKYAYNLEIKQHPCQNSRINNDDFAMVQSALNPSYYQQPVFDFKLDILQFVKQDIIRNPSLRTINILPPSWSTAMGFRALCINATDISSNSPPDYSANKINNEYINRFRERFRFIFYSTVLLSRLNPSMVGIETRNVEPLEPIRVKQKDFDCPNDSNCESDKNKSIVLSEQIKTEMEM